MGGGWRAAAGTERADAAGPRINLVTAVRRTLEHELEVNPRVVVFGEDVGPQGRRARRDPRTAGEIRRRAGCSTPACPRKASSGGRWAWRRPGSCRCRRSSFASTPIRRPSSSTTAAPCAGARRIDSPRPMVVRIPGGFFKCGDPWHSQSNEVQWVHGIGWRVAMPSNAQDAVGLLRTALRGNDPTIFFEHRALLDGSLGAARLSRRRFRRAVRQGESAANAARALTVVTWGAMVERCELAHRAHRRCRPICWTCVPLAVGPAGDARVGAQDPSLPDRA